MGGGAGFTVYFLYLSHWPGGILCFLFSLCFLGIGAYMKTTILDLRLWLGETS